MTDSRPDREQRKREAEWHRHAEECFSNERCLGSFPIETCKEPPIRSHTIARRWLRKIARKSHVYAPVFHTFAREKVDPAIGFPLVSVNSASTLQLYCAKHDNELFREVEVGSFEITDKTAALLHFRGVCRETMTKIGANIVSQTIQFDPPDPEFEALRLGQRIGLRDVAIHYHHELGRLTSGNFSELKYYSCTFEHPLPFAFVGAFLPEIDFEGNALADLADFSKTPESVGVACFSDDGGGHFVLTWDVAGQHARQVATSFHRISNLEKADAVLTLGLEFLENVAFDPDWWEALDPRVRRSLLRRHHAAGTASQERFSDALTSRNTVVGDKAVRSWRSNDGLFYVLR